MKPKLLKTLSLTISLTAFVFVGILYLLLVHSSLNIDKSESLYVYPNQTIDQVMNELKVKGNVNSTFIIKFILKKLGAKSTIPVGHYKIKPGTSDFKLARVLKGGAQTPVRITFNNMRSVDQLAGRLSKQLMADSITILNCFRETTWIKEDGFTEQNFMSVFLPNTYEMWWNSTPEKLLALFRKEYKNFWNENRRGKAEKINLSLVQVSTLASIVEEETNKSDEMPKVAGLYMNRLGIGMPLQADPTVKFAVGDFSIKRILKGHTKIKSPYNTYTNIGLPPGPIRIPSIRAIEAVLSYESHSYIYMCAKSDFSGYHAYATTLGEHNKNASKYHDALNSRGILE